MGQLEYRSLRFEQELMERENFQGVVVMNFTDADVPYTRITKHKHFVKAESPVTVINREYSKACKDGREPYYPANDERNTAICRKHEEVATVLSNFVFEGRIGTY